MVRFLRIAMFAFLFVFFQTLPSEAGLISWGQAFFQFQDSWGRSLEPEGRIGGIDAAIASYLGFKGINTYEYTNNPNITKEMMAIEKKFLQFHRRGLSPFERTGTFFGLILPNGIRFSDGSTAIRHSDVNKIVREFLRGDASHLKSMGLEIGDLLLIISAINLKAFVNTMPEFLMVQERYKDLSSSDQIEIQSDATELLHVLTAIQIFEGSFDRENGDQGLYKIGAFLFSRVLYIAHQNFATNRIRSIAEEKKLDLVDGLGDSETIDLVGEPQAIRQRILAKAQEGSVLSHEEEYQNIYLALLSLNEVDPKHVADLDKLMNILATRDLARLFGATSTILESQARAAEQEIYDIRERVDLMKIATELREQKRQLKSDRILGSNPLFDPFMAPMIFVVGAVLTFVTTPLVPIEIVAENPIASGSAVLASIVAITAGILSWPVVKLNRAINRAQDEHFKAKNNLTDGELLAIAGLEKIVEKARGKKSKMLRWYSKMRWAMQPSAMTCDAVMRF